MTQWFEDITIDRAYDLGTHTFTQNEIIAFAKAYDPQYFHVDPQAAAHSHFGGLVASGWHTVSIGHRLMVDRLDREAQRIRADGGEPGVSGPSPGVNRMDFSAPVRPGDTISYALTVTGKRRSNSIPGWGLLFNLLEARNQNGQLVYSADLVGFSKLRDYKMSLRIKLAMALRGVPGIGRLVRR